MILYRVVWLFLLALNKGFWRLKIVGKENLPATGPFVLAPVHRSFIDFALTSSITRRRMRYMGKDSLWKVSLFGKFISALGAYPVHRGGADREALKRTVEVLQGGEPVVIFPEGTRQSGPKVEHLFEGAAYVASKVGVPVVPVGIGGSEQALRKGKKLPRPVKVTIVVGEPIAPPSPSEGGRTSRRAVHELTVQLRDEIQELFDEAQELAGA
ncbi:MAG: 1-acyl-sn-glycerol-3-phosphate acyltransferase [Acidimicrobiia bacterium]|nr:1-acyl-sn-glycerol-3-phosphate acyltransferase [Acidimicrobiia bacterium]MBV9039365.1 1-acyl-sn-glycerol-3-phosphate acyltransferase [Acidimicrobiia bacterium]